MTRLFYLPLSVLGAPFLVLCVHHLLLSAAVAGAMLCSVASPAPQPLGKLAAVCLTLDAVIVTGALVRSGPRVAALYVFQFHTRDDQPMVYGSHWRYRLLSQAALMLLPLVFRSGTHSRVLTTAWGVFATLTVVFGITSASFMDTIPLAVGYIVGRTRSSAAVPPAGFKFNWKPALAFLLLSSYLAASVLLTGAHHQAPSNYWTSILCAHLLGSQHA